MSKKKCNTPTPHVDLHRCVSVLPNDYGILDNKPTINGKELEGDLKPADIGVLSANANDYEDVPSANPDGHLLVLVDGTVKKISIKDAGMGGGSDGAIQVTTRQELPSIGAKNGIYFVANENATYRWDEDSLQYVPCGRDYMEIQLINGGNAEEY